MTEYKKGDQIAYVPSHTEGDLSHEDVEFGFVMADKGDHCFCRYFYRPIKDMKPTLRTLANSESTPKHSMRMHYFASPSYIDTIIKDIENGVFDLPF